MEKVEACWKEDPHRYAREQKPEVGVRKQKAEKTESKGDSRAHDN